MTDDRRGEPDPNAATAFPWGLTPGVDPAATDPVTEPPPATLPASPSPEGAPFQQPSFQQTSLPGQEVANLPPVSAQYDPSRWLAAPADPALDGATEVIEAEFVEPSAPVGDGAAASAIDSLFGDTRFQDFSDTPLIAPIPRRTSAGSSGRRRAGSPSSISKNQQLLMWIAGSLVAVLALVALFLVGTRISRLLGPVPVSVASSSPSPTPTPTALPVGPVNPGEYHWNALLGGECIAPYESAWKDSYIVVDCTTPHPAQLVYRGVFADPAAAPYPGVDELQKRIQPLCTVPTIINYTIAGTVRDIQIAASFAVDAADWNRGNRSYFCFATRSGGEAFTASIAIPQLPPSPISSPTPRPTP